MKISSTSFVNTEAYFGNSLEELIRIGFVTKGVVREFWAVEGGRLPELDLCKVAGIRLRFGRGETGDSVDGDCRLVGATYHTIDDFDSPGFRGKMPRNICFNDNREALIKKVPLPIVEEGDLPFGGESLGFEGDCGYVSWLDDGFLLHALFLGKLQRTIRITTMLSR